MFDGKILKTITGNPIVEDHINSFLEESLYKISPEFIEIRKGIIDEVISNRPDKARHVAVSCRAMINQLLRNLVPTIEKSPDDSDITFRIKKIFGESESTKELISATVKLLQAINRVQGKGDHEKIDNNMAFFIFGLTEKLVYFILIHWNEKTK